MKKVILMSLCLLSVTGTALATWDEGEPHKMHWPQLPKVGGWDVRFGQWRLADDWRCSESGPVDDIHFWISWAQKQKRKGKIKGFDISIYSDSPASDGTEPNYSRPKDLLWSRRIRTGDFTAHRMQPDWQGWYDPSSDTFSLNNHKIWAQINIDEICEPFEQVEGTIYWLVIDIVKTGRGGKPGWKQSGAPHFNDDAVWWDDNAGQCGQWKELIDPVTGESLDLAFVITPEPATIVLLGLGSLLLFRGKH